MEVTTANTYTHTYTLVSKASSPIDYRISMINEFIFIFANRRNVRSLSLFSLSLSLLSLSSFSLSVSSFGNLVKLYETPEPNLWKLEFWLNLLTLDYVFLHIFSLSLDVVLVHNEGLWYDDMISIRSSGSSTMTYSISMSVPFLSCFTVLTGKTLQFEEFPRVCLQRLWGIAWCQNEVNDSLFRSSS